MNVTQIANIKKIFKNMFGGWDCCVYLTSVSKEDSWFVACCRLFPTQKPWFIRDFGRINAMIEKQLTKTLMIIMEFFRPTLILSVGGIYNTLIVFPGGG